MSLETWCEHVANELDVGRPIVAKGPFCQGCGGDGPLWGLMCSGCWAAMPDAIFGDSEEIEALKAEAVKKEQELEAAYRRRITLEDQLAAVKKAVTA